MSAEALRSRNVGRGLLVVLALASGLVGGQQFRRHLLDRADGVPAPHYVASAGEVTDAYTGLVWQRAVDPHAHSWAEARTVCGRLPGGWRLPHVMELQSLLDLRRRNPPIDPEAFPDTPSAYFWSSTPFVGNDSVAWIVGFLFGDAHLDRVDRRYRVRCVR